MSTWLPALMLFSNHGNDWDIYLEAIYDAFCADFLDSTPTFQGTRLGLKRHPVSRGKEATFWHFTSEGKIEEERLPDFRRCERIRWPRPVIESDGTDEPLKIWEEIRNNETRVHIWAEESEYLVVLAKRNGYILPWTGYPVVRDHEKTKLQKRWERNR
ncbi:MULTISPECIES: hypothetical protein [Burkholderia]|uniref:hypothetical protein n=1 Tax=Burkholderia TaxID=32008 RepID=UPI00128D25F6|nr:MULTISPECIES: hypothetical protein [Burkholderia]MPV65829.1 hypothetical protein [Burkholderia sp. BE17]